MCKNKKSVTNYNTIAWKYLQFLNISKKIRDLEDSFKSTDRDRQNIRLNVVDEKVTEILLHAEKKYMKLRMGAVD